MGPRSSDTDAVREVRLEGAGLVVIGAVFVGALAGAFFLGRWYERSSRPPLPLAGPGFEAAAVPGEAPRVGATDVAETATYFDSVQGGEQQLEPQREAAARPTEREVSAGPAASRPGGSGDFYVQVFAGRDEQAAAGLVRKLELEGYTVRLDTERESGGALYKVRVGGYESQDFARGAASELQDRGYTGAWVTKVP
jgi:cell division septation protein DedD